MSAEQIGGILFWTLFAAMILVFLGLFLGIRVPARAMAKAGGGLVACAAAILFVSRLPTEIVGGILTWGLLALMYFGLFWALTRKR
ncbi:MAG: hypothetical protein J7575_02340 [Chloroflexi bacterium]|nr:hypothetical protein [Chloroflexota bacterium]